MTCHKTAVSRDDVASFVSDVNAVQTEEVAIDCEIHCGDKEKRSSMPKIPGILDPLEIH